MGPQSEHLTDAQIEEYGAVVSAEAVDSTAEMAGTGHDSVEQHLADCVACRERVLAFERARFALVTDPSVKALDVDRLGPDCPDQEALRDLAAGLVSPKLAPKLTQHASQCDRCGPVLRMYTEDFSEDVNTEDQVVISSLKSSSGRWQKKLVRRMILESGSAPASTQRRSFPWRWMLAPAALAACAAIAFGVWYSQLETPEKVEKLLAQAYTEDRQLEMRFPGAAWGPMRVTLGPNDSVFSKPRPLFKAEEIIARREPSKPRDVAWLRAKAESEIIEHQPSAAISNLNAALEIQPDSISLMLDLALAHVEQAPISGDQRDFPKAIDLLSQITQKDPRNKEALFNLALVYSRLEMWDLAAKTWESYLGLDPDSLWAQEAKQKLDQAKSKLKLSLQQPPAESLDAAALLKLSDDEIDFNVEQYQDIAIRHWLAGAIADPQTAERGAVARLAEIMLRKHSDSWLMDFLGPPTARDSTGAAHLSAAASANLKGHYAEATKESRQAEQFLRRQSNRAGGMRAQYESVYAIRRQLHGHGCIILADTLQHSLVATSYHWLQARLSIERAICLNFVGRIPASNLELDSGLQSAKRLGFPVLVLTNLGTTQGLENQQGRYGEAWQEGLLGLSRYWLDPPILQRVYQFYASLAVSSQRMQLSSTAEVLLRHAVDLLATQDDRIQLGAAHLELAKLLIGEKHDAEAKNEFLTANELFKGEREEPTSRSYRLAGKIGLADVQLRLGTPAQALSTLREAGELLSETDGYFVSLQYYRLLGNIELTLKSLAASEDAYKHAIVIAESSLGQLKSEPDRLQWVRGASDAYRGMVRVLLEQGKPEQALKMWEWYESRPSPDDIGADIARSRKSGANWRQISALITTIPTSFHTHRLVFAVFDDGVQIWVGGDDQLKFAWVPIRREDLEEKIKYFALQCAQRDSPLAEIQRQGEDLFKLLLDQPIKLFPSGFLVAVETDSPLAGLCLEALRSHEGWYFGERYPIVHSPGLLAENRLRRLSAISGNSAFLLANGSGDYLPGQEEQRDTIASYFRRHQIIGSEADPTKVRRLVAGSNIFGFMGHGVPRSSGMALKLNRSVLLEAKDFPPHALSRLQLAVLAACSTGTGQDGLLDNRTLVHAFLAGGVPNIIASNWDVDSLATARLLTAFYTHLVQHEPVALALFASRNEIIKSHPHPFFWAGFSLIGKTE